jgi:hypothetical protein
MSYYNIRRMVNSRPGIDSANYATFSAYRNDAAKAARQRRDALELLNWLEPRMSYADLAALIGTSGRLELRADGSIHYTAGQYYCLEYRAAVAAAVARGIRAVWSRGRDWDYQAFCRFARSTFSRSAAQYLT